MRADVFFAWAMLVGLLAFINIGLWIARHAT
jgi:uncharacterized membrane protein YiaA